MRALRILAAFILLSATAHAAPRTQFDIAYGTDPQQKLDVYMPEKPAKNAPILVMVHGGAWRLGDKRDEESVTYKAPHYTDKGYVFVSMNYRMANTISPLAQMYDVGDALAFIENKANEWGGDPRKIVLMGHSAGGHLIGLVAAVPPELKYPLKGTVFLDGAGFDISYIMQQPHLPFYDEVFGKDPKNWQVNSPIYHLSEKSAPMFLVCSTNNQFCQNADAFMAKAKAFGTAVEMYKVDMDHRPINVELGKPSPYTDRIDRFIASVVK